MQEKGWGRSKVRRALVRARALDRTFADGSILGSMCTAPHPSALEAHAAFAETNLGDPEHFPGTKALEEEVLEDLRLLLRAPKRGAGRFLTGGTEANLYALYVAREKTGRKTVILPEHAHFSFEKAARLLGMKLRWIRSRPDGRADVAAMAAAINSRTAILIGVAGSTELGLVDDIRALATVARKAGVPFHVDAAFGGYVLPFLPASTSAPSFDFRVPGVTSISIDPHKGGMATVPAGVLMLRDGRDWDLVAVDTPYVSTSRQAQLLGTRPGAAAAATWAVHRALGRQGFEQVVATCMADANHLVQGLEARGWQLVRPRELNVVTFHADNAARLSARLDAAGLRVNVVPRYEAIRIVVNPHVDRTAIDRFLAVLGEAEHDR